MAQRYSIAEKLQVLSLYESGMTQQEIANRLGRTQTTVGENLRAWGAITRRTGPRNRLNVRDDFFSHIETEEQAYWLGFFFADGAVTCGKNGQLIAKVELAKQDRSHLSKLAKTLRAS